jgi:hypothetical protein
LQHEAGGRSLVTSSCGEEIGALLQPLHWVRFSASGAETFAPACTPRREDFAATHGRGAGAESVTALAHQFAGLIGPFHGSLSAGRGSLANSFRVSGAGQWTYAKAGLSTAAGAQKSRGL